MTPFLYSLPPAGNKIPFSLLLRAMMGGNRNGGLEKSELLKKVTGDAHILYLSSGRAALWLILNALSRLHPERHKVIIPAYTCPAVASAVLKAGLEPVLCDINLDDFGYSVEDLDRIIDKSVLAVIVVHLFGFTANIDKMTPLCRKHDIFVVEDAAQAFGNELPETGTKLGRIGDAGFFSFGRGKPLSAIHGGLVVTESDTIYENALEIYRSLDAPSGGESLKYSTQLGCYGLFVNPHLFWISQRIPSLHLGETIFDPDFSVTSGLGGAAVIVEGLLRSLENDRNARMEKTEWYNRNLLEAPGIERHFHVAYPFHRYPLVVNDKLLRDAIIDGLNSAGISGALFYPCPLNKLPGLRDVLQDSRTYPNAKLLSDKLVTLPVHEGVTLRDMNHIKSVIQDVLTK